MKPVARRGTAVAQARPAVVAALLVGLALVLAVLLGGCGTQQATSTGGSPPGHGGSGSGGPPTTVGPPRPAPSGSPVSPQRCHTGDLPTVRVTGADLPLRAAKICTLRTGTWKPVTGQTNLDRLAAALMRPSITPKPGTVCPMYATIPHQVIVTAATGRRFLARIPDDGCGHERPDVVAVLNRLVPAS